MLGFKSECASQKYAVKAKKCAAGAARSAQVRLSAPSHAILPSGWATQQCEYELCVQVLRTMAMKDAEAELGTVASKAAARAILTAVIAAPADSRLRRLVLMSPSCRAAGEVGLRVGFNI